MTVAFRMCLASLVRVGDGGHRVLTWFGVGNVDLQSRRGARFPPLNAVGMRVCERCAIATLVEPHLDFGDRRVWVVGLDDEDLLIADALLVTFARARRDGRLLPLHDGDPGSPV